MICGLPGSGKSTLAAKLEAELPALRLIPDAWIARMNEHGHKKGKRKLVESLQWDVAQKTLHLGLDVVLENGFWSKQERQQYRRQAAAVGAQTKLYFLNVSIEELKRRLQARNKNLSGDTFYIDPQKIDSWLVEFEPPTSDELND